MALLESIINKQDKRLSLFYDLNKVFTQLYCHQNMIKTFREDVSIKTKIEYYSKFSLYLNLKIKKIKTGFLMYYSDFYFLNEISIEILKNIKKNIIIK